MRLRGRTATAAIIVVASLALAACGEQIAKHLDAGDTVHAALTSVLNSPTTEFTITAENLPGRASLTDGSFSIVVTTSHLGGGSSVPSVQRRAVDISVYHETTDLVDLREVKGSVYIRLDLKDLAAFGSPGSFASISKSLNKLASRPGLGYIHDILIGGWVGVSDSTVLAVAHQLESQLPGAGQSTVNLQKIKQLRIAVSSSLIQAVRTWLSIHQMSGDEYSLSLPIRSFVGSLLHQIATPLAKYLKEPFLSQAELGKLVNEIPSTLSLHANMWVQNGSLSKLQIFIPDTSASLLIGITHPASPVEVPGGATMLTVKNLTDLFATAMSSGLSANPATAVLGSL